MKTKPEIKAMDYKIYTVKDEFPVCVKNLDKQVMFTLFCKELLKTVVANNIDLDKFNQIIEELVGKDSTKQQVNIIMRVVGGDTSLATKKYLNDLYAKFENSSNSKVKITLDSYSGGGVSHPSKVEVDCYGEVSKYVDDMF